MANDESYRDPTNLEKKIQKHQEFDAEITANEQRIVSIEQVGVCRSHDIEQRIVSIEQVGVCMSHDHEQRI